MSKKILCIFGTRPEAIKFAPLIYAFKKTPELFDIKICITGQHKEMLRQVIDFFSINVDYDLDVMKEGQTLFDTTSNIIKKLEYVLDAYKPDIVFVQGDTTTAFAGALAAYYKNIKIAHLEAGLRSGNLYSPFPEEGNRILAGHLAYYHFAPTDKAKQNLNNEGINNNVHVVGNTVVDALLMCLDKIKDESALINITKDRKIILVTGHRRESFGKPFESICRAIKKIAEEFKNDVEVIYPVHLNPNVREPVNKILSDSKNVKLIEPLDYAQMIWLMSKSYIILTDSGGVQEEAPSLGKPVLVMRDVTERQEGVDAGTAMLVGTNENKIFKSVSELLLNKHKYDQMAQAKNPYGDGKTSERIVNIVKNGGINR